MNHCSMQKIRYRQVSMVVLLSLITLTLYNWYLLFQWAKEVNGLYQREKYSPMLVLFLTFLTMGVLGGLFEIFFAFDIKKKMAERKLDEKVTYFPFMILGLNVIAFLFAFIPVMFLLAVICGVTASAMIQTELNRFADCVDDSMISEK